jgi:hypothetical protein
MRHSHHPHRDIRFAFAVALPACLAEGVSSSATAALLSLMEDQDEEVRDLATFGVGSLLEIDGPEIPDALVRRLADPGADTSGEAMVGLAQSSLPSVLGWAALGRRHSGAHPRRSSRLLEGGLRS